MPAHPHVSFFSEIRFMSGNFFGHAYTEITLFENSKFENQTKIF